MKKQVNWTTGVLDHVHAEVCVCVYVCVRFEPTLGVERLVFGFAVQLYTAIRLVVNTCSARRDISSLIGRITMKLGTS